MASKRQEKPIRTVGIDLGTGTTLIMYMDGQSDIALKDDDDKPFFPSVVAFTETETLVGQAAKDYKKIDPVNTICEVKRLIGRKMGKAVEQFRKKVQYRIIEGEDSSPLILANSKDGKLELEPETVSAMILQKVKQEAEEQWNCRIQNAVLTVPAYFSNEQRQATVKAAEMADLNVLKLINEPTSASIVYGRNMNNGEQKNVLVFDVGSGTFDVSCMEIVKDESGKTFHRVLAIAGKNYFGGLDFTERISHFIVDQAALDEKKITDDNIEAMTKIWTAAETAKCALSKKESYVIKLPKLLPGYNFERTITRTDFVIASKDLFRSSMKEIMIVLEKAKLTKEQIDDIQLVGGSSFIPEYRELLKKFFNGLEPRTFKPREDVAYGAAALAALHDENSHFTNIVIEDVCAFDIGVEVAGGMMEVLVSRNSRLPFSGKNRLWTNTVGLGSATLNIYEGNSEKCNQNVFLGKFSIKNMTTREDSHTPFEVFTDIDKAMGIIKLKAKEVWGNGEVVAELDRSLIEKNRTREESMMAQASKFKKELNEEFACARAKNELQYNCLTLEKDLASLKETTPGFEQARKRFFECSRATKNWLHGSVKRIKLVELEERGNSLTRIYSEAKDYTQRNLKTTVGGGLPLDIKTEIEVQKDTEEDGDGGMEFSNPLHIMDVSAVREAENLGSGHIGKDFLVDEGSPFHHHHEDSGNGGLDEEGGKSVDSTTPDETSAYYVENEYGEGTMTTEGEIDSTIKEPRALNDEDALEGEDDRHEEDSSK